MLAVILLFVFSISVFYFLSSYIYKICQINKFNYFLAQRQHQKYKIALVTYDDRYHEYQDYTELLNRRYCKLYNIDYIDYSKSTKFDKIPPWWRKVFMVQDVLKTGKYDYVIWLDKDACFVNKDINLHNLLSNINKSFIVSNDPAYDGNLTSGHILEHIAYSPRFFKNKYDVNAGCFMVKNDEKGREIMNQWIKRFKPSEWYKCEHKDCSTINDNKVKLPNALYGWKVKSAWAGDSYEQGQLVNILQFHPNDIHIFSSHILADLSDYPFFVSHKMGKENSERLNFFKKQSLKI